MSVMHLASHLGENVNQPEMKQDSTFSPKYIRKTYQADPYVALSTTQHLTLVNLWMNISKNMFPKLNLM